MTTLEKQQDAAMRKISELETSVAESKMKMEGIISELEEEKTSLKTTLEELKTVTKILFRTWNSSFQVSVQ